MRLATISTAAVLSLFAVVGVVGANETHTSYPTSTRASSVALEPVTIIAEGVIRAT
jgi:hypothetical protein